MSEFDFLHLNKTWNADPNAPCPKVHVSGDLVSVTFYLNAFAYDALEGEKATLSFLDCSRWRVDPTNDEAWYSGKGRFSHSAPRWGEFFEVCGQDISESNVAWNVVSENPENQKHFIFYFRDEAFECSARDWTLDRTLPERAAN